MLLGLAAISRLPVALACVGVLLLVLRVGWPIRLPVGAERSRLLRRTVLFGLGMAIPVGLYFLYNLARWGTLMDQGYTRIPGVLEDPIYVKHGIFAHRVHPAPHPRDLPAWLELRGRPAVHAAVVVGPRAVPDDAAVPVAGPGAAAGLAGLRVGWWPSRWSAIPIVTHGNVGLTQFGYRFSLDVQVFLFVILATVFERGMSRLAWLAAFASIVICAYAIWAISIDFVSY